LLLVSCLLAPSAARAQTRPSSGGVIDGIVSTQAGTIRLAGAQLSVRDAQDRQVATMLADGDGHFVVAGLPDGVYRVSAALAGFETTSAAATVIAGRVTTVALDLPIASISQTVDVVGSSTLVSSQGTLAKSDSIGSLELDQYAPGGGFQAALRLLAASSKCRAASASRADVRVRRASSLDQARWSIRRPG